MTENDARTRLQAMTAWDTAPELTDDEITSLVVMSRIADPYGMWPGDTGWTPTYNLNIGAAEGWRWKVARADSLDGGNVTSSKVGDVSETYSSPAERFQAKADMYQKKIYGTIGVGRFSNPLVPPEILP
jgi:hypothetical protein